MTEEIQDVQTFQRLTEKKTFLKKIFWLLLIYEGGEKTDDIGTKEIEKKITKFFTKKLLLWECKSQNENILFL